MRSSARRNRAAGRACDAPSLKSTNGRLWAAVSFCAMMRIMRAMVIHAAGEALRLEERAVPVPAAGEILIRVRACGVCRTDLHVVDGELPQTRYPVIPGHEIIGEVAALGADVDDFREGERVGVPWLGWTCGKCRYCLAGEENLCDFARFTGCSIDGGYAEYAVADRRFCFRLPEKYDDAHAAPLLCAGL